MFLCRSCQRDRCTISIYTGIGSCIGAAVQLVFDLKLFCFPLGIQHQIACLAGGDLVHSPGKCCIQIPAPEDAPIPGRRIQRGTLSRCILRRIHCVILSAIEHIGHRVGLRCCSKDFLDHLIGDEGRSAQNHAGLDVHALGIVRCDALLAVHGEDQRCALAMSQRAAAEAVGEVIRIGNHHGGCVGEVLLGDVHAGVVTGRAFNSGNAAVGLQRIFDPGVHRGRAADDHELVAVQALQEFLLAGGQAVLHQHDGHVHRGGGQAVGEVLAGANQNVLIAHAGLLDDGQAGFVTGCARQALHLKAVQAGFHALGNGVHTAQQVNRAAGLQIGLDVSLHLFDFLVAVTDQQDGSILLIGQVAAGQGIRKVRTAGNYNVVELVNTQLFLQHVSRIKSRLITGRTKHTGHTDFSLFPGFGLISRSVNYITILIYVSAPTGEGIGVIRICRSGRIGRRSDPLAVFVNLCAEYSAVPVFKDHHGIFNPVAVGCGVGGIARTVHNRLVPAGEGVGRGSTIRSGGIGRHKDLIAPVIVFAAEYRAIPVFEHHYIICIEGYFKSFNCLISRANAQGRLINHLILRFNGQIRLRDLFAIGIPAFIDAVSVFIRKGDQTACPERNTVALGKIFCVFLSLADIQHSIGGRGKQVRIFNEQQISRNHNFFQTGAVFKCIAADGGNRLGQNDLLQFTAIQKRRVADIRSACDHNPLQRIGHIRIILRGCDRAENVTQPVRTLLRTVTANEGQLHFLQAGAAQKGIGTDPGDAFRNRDTRKSRAARKGIAVNGIHAAVCGDNAVFAAKGQILSAGVDNAVVLAVIVRILGAHRHGLYGRAVGKHHVSHVLHGIRNMNLGQTFAAFKSCISDRLHVPKLHLLEACTFGKCRTAQGLHIVGDIQCYQCFTAHECRTADGSQIFAQGQRFDLFAAIECAILDFRQTVRQMQTLQVFTHVKAILADAHQAFPEGYGYKSGVVGKRLLAQVAQAGGKFHVDEQMIVSKAIVIDGMDALSQIQLRKHVAIFKCPLSHSLHAVAQVHGSQCIAVPERPFPNGQNGVRERKLRQAAAAFESVISNTCHCPIRGNLAGFAACGQAFILRAHQAVIPGVIGFVVTVHRDAFQTSALAKRRVTDPGNSLSQMYGFQRGAAVKGFFSNICHAVGNIHLRQRLTARNRLFANGRQTARQGQLCQLRQALHGTAHDRLCTFAHLKGSGQGAFAAHQMAAYIKRTVFPVRCIIIKTGLGKGILAQIYHRFRKLDFRCRFTFVKSIISDGGHAGRDHNALQLVAVLESTGTNDPQSVRQDHFRQIAAAFKGTFGNVGDAIQYRAAAGNGLPRLQQIRTYVKRICVPVAGVLIAGRHVKHLCTNSFHAIRNIDVIQTAAHGKGFGSQILQGFGKKHRLQGSAVVKCAHADGFQALRKCDGSRKLIAIGKCAVSDSLQFLAKFQSLQLFAVEEGFLSDADQALGQLQRSQIGAFRKCKSTDGFHAFRNGNIHQVGTFLKGLRANADHRIPTDGLGDVQIIAVLHRAAGDGCLSVVHFIGKSIFFTHCRTCRQTNSADGYKRQQ